MTRLVRALAASIGLAVAIPATAQDALDSPFLFYGYANGNLDGAEDRYNGGTVHLRNEINPGALLNLELTYMVPGFDLLTLNDGDYTNASATYQQVFEAAPTYSLSGLLGLAYGRSFSGFADGDNIAITMGAMGEVQLGATGALHGQIRYHGAGGFNLGIGGGFTQYFMSGGAIRIDYMIYESVAEARLMFGYAM